MKKEFLNLCKEVGLDKLTVRQIIILCWNAFAVFLILACNIEESEWYALPILLLNFIASYICMRKYIPVQFWNEK